MMEYNVSRLNPEYNFIVTGSSYAGDPKPNTVIYITKKVEGLLENLRSVHPCLVFIEDNIDPDKSLQEYNLFIRTCNPQMEYARFLSEFAEEAFRQERKLKYTLTADGWYCGQQAEIGEDAYIEQGCLIGHRVRIGAHCRISAGAVIKNCVIGDNFVCGENAVVGANGFTMAEDEDGNKFRIPTMGKVIIGDNVEVGQLDSICVGSGGDTVIQDNVKLDALVHIGHNDNLGKNTEIPAGAIIGGFVNTGEHAYCGINSCVRNRRDLGPDTVVGMGAVVTKSVPAGMTVIGNPAREYVKGRHGNS